MVTSKEALDKIVDGYNEITTSPKPFIAVVAGNPLIRCYKQELDIIQKDLDRLEKLENEIKFLADNKMQIFKFPSGRTILGFDISELEKEKYQIMVDDVLENLIKELKNND